MSLQLLLVTATALMMARRLDRLAVRHVGVAAWLAATIGGSLAITPWPAGALSGLVLLAMAAGTLLALANKGIAGSADRRATCARLVFLYACYVILYLLAVAPLQKEAGNVMSAFLLSATAAGFLIAQGGGRSTAESPRRPWMREMATKPRQVNSAGPIDFGALSQGFYHDLHQPGDELFSLIDTIALTPAHDVVAFDGLVTGADGGFPSWRIAFVARDGAAAPRILDNQAANDRRPCWSPDGASLAFLSDRDSMPGQMQLWLRAKDDASSSRAGPVITGHSVEACEWSPSGKRLLLISQTHDGARGDRPAWSPKVSSNDLTALNRYLWTWTPASGALDLLAGAGPTVWEASWCGEDAIAAVVSDHPTEGGWYDSYLALVPLATPRVECLLRPEEQIACVVGSADGRFIAFVSGYCHHGMAHAPIMVFDTQSRQLMPRLTPEVEASQLAWRDCGRLFFVGVASLDTITGTFDVAAGTVAIESRTASTSGLWAPTAWPVGASGHIIGAHGHDLPPQLRIVTDDGDIHVLADFTMPGSARIIEDQGRFERLAWHGRDGLPLEGLLVTPARAAPHPLVVYLHGGPICGFRDKWALDYHVVPLLVRAGYAVFMPNPRGSFGCGQEFVRRMLGDIGGEDCHDILAGLDQLVATGDFDSRRLVVGGGSYGGFLTARLITQTERFAAAFPMSPFVDCRSEHFTACHPELFLTLLKDSPYNVSGHYDDRSPLLQARTVTTPTMIIAGGVDRITPPGQAEAFHNALVQQGVPSELLIYPCEGHGVFQFEAQIDQGTRLLTWLARFAPAQEN